MKADSRGRSKAVVAAMATAFVVLLRTEVAAAEGGGGACLFVLPIEAGPGATWTQERAGPLSSGAISILPGFMFGRPGTFWGRWAASGMAQLEYRNPDWDFGVGGRASVLLAAIIHFIPIKAAVEGTYLVRGQGGHVAFGPMFGLGRLLQLSTFYTYETDRKMHSAYVGIGFDAAALGDLVSSVTWYVPQGDGGMAVP